MALLFLGHWGAPNIILLNGIAYIPVAMSSIIESVGDYIATAHICEQPRPPIHAINRGIAIEGLGSIIAALTGVCHATTTWSNMIGLISYTGVNRAFHMLYRFIACCVRKLQTTKFVVCFAVQGCPPPVAGFILYNFAISRRLFQTMYTR